MRLKKWIFTLFLVIFWSGFKIKWSKNADQTHPRIIFIINNGNLILYYSINQYRLTYQIEICQKEYTLSISIFIQDGLINAFTMLLDCALPVLLFLVYLHFKRKKPVHFHVEKHASEIKPVMF